jgi:hypothetical protein
MLYVVVNTVHMHYIVPALRIYIKLCQTHTLSSFWDQWTNNDLQNITQKTKDPTS